MTVRRPPAPPRSPKYVQARAVLRLLAVYIEDYCGDRIYAKLQAAGYTWNGVKWVRANDAVSEGGRADE